MIGKDFIETYQRAENILTTNREKVIIDFENKFVYTTPLFESGAITKIEADQLGLTNDPDNINIIIDSIVLFSTNPNIQNYLPLSIKIGTSSSIEFTDVTFTVLNDYKILVTPPLTLDSIGNRRYSRNRYVYQFDNFIDPDQVLITDLFDIGQSRDRLYSFWKDSLNNYNLVEYDMNTGEDKKIAIPLYKEDPPNTVISGHLETNNLQAVFSYQDTNDKWNLLDISDGTGNEILDAPLNNPIVDYFIVDNILIVLVYDGGATPWTYGVFIKNPVTGKYDDLYTIGTANDIPDLTPPVYWTLNNSNSLYYLWDDTVANKWGIYQVDNLLLGAPLSDQKLRLDLGENPFEDLKPYKMFAGGEYNQTFTVILTNTNDTEVWVWNSLTKFKTFIGDFTQYDIYKHRPHKYNNIIWFNDSSETGSTIKIVNLDNGEVSTFDRKTLGIYQFREPLVYYSDYAFQYTGLDANTGSTILSNLLGNERLYELDLFQNYGDKVSVNRVYKVSKWYDERVLPYSKDGGNNIIIELEGQVPISQLELFKFVIDYRIRFSKNEEDHYQITSGEPKSDFTEEDFHKIYSSI